MELDKVIIDNFRSIEHIELSLKPRCRVLIGIGEAGKSNIIKALSLLSKDAQLSKSDIREPLPSEGQISDSSIKFAFKLSHEELNTIFENLSTQIFSSDINKPILEYNNKKLNLKQLIEERNEIIWKVDLLEKHKIPVYGYLPDTYRVLSNWKKPSNSAPKFKLDDGEEIELKNELLLNVEDLEGLEVINADFLEDIDAEYINQIIGQKFKEVLVNNLPECILWKYDEKNLLPSKISISEFSSNPKSCIPLMNMFQLAKYKDVPRAFKEARERNPNHGINNLLERVSIEATKHFRSIWKDYKSIKFYLVENGDKIDASVKDVQNRYGFEERSDGFKRFVTFLLVVSAQTKNDLMKNALLLIDEPDTSLHLSAAKYLRQELFNISKTNYVVYSTHSIFMIDKDNISRHLIVKKEDEKTSIIEANESNIFDEEVLYNALGYSVFENLRQKNIIFEGWRDKKLFQVAIKDAPSRHANLKTKFTDVGLAHSKGVSFMKYLTPIMELANRECFILSDNDEPSRRTQEKFNEEKLFGVWKRYSEILLNTPEITAEDFIKKEAILKVCKNIKQTNPNLKELTIDDFRNNRGIIYNIKNWLSIPSIDENKQKEIIEIIKDEIFNELKQSNIEDNYYNLLQKLSEQI